MRLILTLFVLMIAPAVARADTAIVAGGCFWCLEANFESVPGVSKVVSGYTGGTVDSPTYDDVKSEQSGHYEAVKITYDPGKVSYGALIRLFLRSTDVVDGGGQFCDRGESYRPVILPLNDDQRAAAEAELAKATAELGQKLAVETLPAATFWMAEDYHQDYYKGEGYVITRRGPKVQSDAYAFYRKSCGRDSRVKELWGDEAAFVH